MSQPGPKHAGGRVEHLVRREQDERLAVSLLEVKRDGADGRAFERAG